MTSPKVSGLNHITLAVDDLERSLSFYVDLLGCKLRKKWPGGAYLEAGPLWLCLSLDALARSTPHTDYTHIAFDVSATDFEPLASRIRQSGAKIWKENKSEGASLYFLDPNGHKLELHASTLTARIAAMADKAQ